ncbi:MAG: hypothetical protein ACR2JB_21020 [Bryobacteraceae bacterium]
MVEPRPLRASVYQVGRFGDDERTWNEKLSNPQIAPEKKGGLRFYLTTASDFKVFQEFVEQEGKGLVWAKNVAPEDGKGMSADPQEKGA